MERYKIFWALFFVGIMYVIILPSSTSQLQLKANHPLVPKDHEPLAQTEKPPATTNTPVPTPTPTPSPIVQDSNSVVFDTVQIYLLNAVNEYRKSLELSPVKPDKNTCDFAKIREKEITSEFNHKGFQNRISTKSLPYPSYSYVTENIARDSHYQDVVARWKNSSGHAANMSADTPYVCIAYRGNDYTYEGWKP